MKRIRLLACLAISFLVAPLLAILYGAVFGRLYDSSQVFAAFLLFMMGCAICAASAILWEDLK